MNPLKCAKCGRMFLSITLRLNHENDCQVARVVPPEGNTLEERLDLERQGKRPKGCMGPLVVSNSKVVSFLYELLRDHLPAADVENLVRNSEANTNVIYSNGFLAQYAQHLAERLAQSPTSNDQPNPQSDSLPILHTPLGGGGTGVEVFPEPKPQ